MPILVKENPNFSKQEIDDLLRKKWRELPEAEKKQYLAMQKVKRKLWQKE